MIGPSKNFALNPVDVSVSGNQATVRWACSRTRGGAILSSLHYKLSSAQGNIVIVWPCEGNELLTYDPIWTSNQKRLSPSWGTNPEGGRGQRSITCMLYQSMKWLTDRWASVPGGSHNDIPREQVLRPNKWNTRNSTLCHILVRQGQTVVRMKAECRMLTDHGERKWQHIARCLLWL